MASNTIRERMRARRQTMQENTMADSDTDTPRGNPSDDTWAAAMDDTTRNAQPGDTSMEVEDGKKEADTMVKSVEKRRRRAKREADRASKRRDEDVGAQMEAAKANTKRKVMDEAGRGGTDAEDTSAADETMPTIPSLDIGESMDRQGASPPATARSTTSPRKAVDDGGTPRKVTKGMNMSMRERLKEKMRAAKDQGKDAAYKQAAGGRMLKGQREKMKSTRFDEGDEGFDQDEDKLTESLRTRSKWRKAADKVSEESYMPTHEEQFDFFARQFEPEPEPVKATEPAPSTSEGERPAGEEAPAEGEGAAPAEPEAPKEDDKEGEKEEDETEKSGEEDPLLGPPEEAWRLFYMGKARYTPFHERLKVEDKLFYYPSVREANLKEKIDGGVDARLLEDEGFYVGIKPIVASSNLNKMENRLLKTTPNKGQGWFGEDGRLIAEPDPLKEIPTRPPIPEEITPELQTDYRKAYIVESQSKYMAGRNGERFQLDVDVNTIQLTHHHLFSREHVLASRLTEEYQQYLSRDKKKAAEYLTEKLKALKSAYAHVQSNIEVLQKDKNPGKGLEDQEHRLREYKHEIRETRRQRDAEWLADRQLLKNIIQTWKMLKSVRQLQQANNTSLKLQIKKEPMNKAEDEREWEEDIREEMEEIAEDNAEVYHAAMEKYHHDLDEWKRNKLAQKEAKQRQKDRKKKKKKNRRRGSQEELEDATGTENDDLDDNDDVKDQDMIAKDFGTKPEKPKSLDDPEYRNKILEKYNERRRKPGEPMLTPELSNGATISPNNQCKRGEQVRRSDVNKYKIWVKVLFNEKEVSRTPAKAIGQDFLIRFAQIFNIEILQWPESIKLEVHEASGLSSTLISDVYAAIPDTNVTSENVILEEVEFSSDIRVKHAHEGVGSGMPFSFDAANSDRMTMMTTGTLVSSVAWSIDEDGNVMVPPTGETVNQLYNAMKGMDAVAAIGVSGMSDMDKLTKWISQSRLDPNDPNNADLMYLFRPIGGGDAIMSNLRLPEHFRLEMLQEEFNFCTDEDINNSRRFNMISLRERGEPTFQSKVIPCFDKEIADEVFMEYEKKKREKDKLRILDEKDSHQVAVAKFMQQVREQVMLRYRIAQHEKTFDDIIKEEGVPNISVVFPKLLKLLEPKRQLKPVRKERKQVPAQNLVSMDVKILVNIVRAFGIPIRSESVPSRANAGASFSATSTAHAQAAAGGVRNIAGDTQVRPYIEVMFQRQTEATSVADGPNPSWNEELSIPFKPPNNDYSPGSLEAVNDTLYFNIFDEYIIDVTQDDRDRGTSIHRRIEKRWLGTIKIPFSTIYFNSRIDGTFRVEKPPVLLGYTSEGRSHSGGEDAQIGHGDDTYLTMFVTVEPPLKQADPVKEKFDSNESPEIQAAAEKFLAELNAKYPKREYKATVIDINGKSVFLTKFVKPLAPPAELATAQPLPAGDERDAAVRKVARFVSLIPFVSDSVVFPGICDIWSTCDQFLQMLQGDEEEHAVLLCNYLLHMGEKAYILLGSAIPEGPTAYVLTMGGNGKAAWIWNASTGERYSSKDNYCPVQSVGCLVSPDNIYANIQPKEVPSQVSFDLNNSANWKHFFGKSFPSPSLPSVQLDAIHYHSTKQAEVNTIQEDIERTLKNKVMEWRPRYITRWNRYCVQAFRKLLVKLEENHGRGAQDHTHDLESVVGSYKMCGFPINQPWTGEIGPIVDSVFATGVQNYESSDVEFALAVYVHPYPNNVMSVWVYIANLVRKR